MRKTPYLFSAFLFVFLFLDLSAQSCPPRGGWGYAGTEALGGLINLIDRTFSGNRNPGNDPMYERANLAFLQGDYSEAIQGFTQAMERNPGNRNYLARLRYQRGICYYILAEYEEAKADFNAAIRIRPDVPEAYYFRGKVYQTALEQPYLARRDFQRVLNMTDASDIQKAYAHFYLGQEDRAESIMHTVIAESRRQKEAYGYALYNMAGLQALMGKPESACRYLNDALIEGFREHAWLLLDDNLDPVRHSACYQTILREFHIQGGDFREPREPTPSPYPTPPAGRPTAPAYLTIKDLQFVDPSGNNRVDIGETTYIEFVLENEGQGAAFDMELYVNEEQGKTGLGYSQSRTLGNLPPGIQKRIRIEVAGGRDLQEGNASFRIEVKERNGFDTNPAYITLPTGEAFKPNLTITDPHFTSTVGGKARPGVPMTLKLAVQNTGRGKARDVKASVALPQNVFMASEPEISIGELEPGDFKVLDIEFFTNRRFTKPTVPVSISISEATGTINQTETFTVTMNQDLEVDARVVIQPNDAPVEVDINQVQLRSDVDRNLPRTNMRNPDAIAVIIGNRDYQNSDVPSVDFALNDALSMKRYLVEVLGYDANNVIMLANASQADFNGMFGTKESHKARLYNLVKKGSSDVFIYYSGHGAPDIESNEGYFVPVDCDPTLVRFNGYAIKTLYDNLGKIPYRKLTVVIDACFSGSSDKGTLMPFTSLARIRTSSNLLNDPNAVVLTSATNDQVATWYPEQFHGLFTYYFLKGLQGEANTDGNRNLSLLELKSYLNEQVPYMARRLRNRNQTPEIYGQESAILINY